MMKAELDRMNAENEHLRSVLDEINGKYQSLKMHITSLMNHQHNPDAADQNKSADHKVFFFTYCTWINRAKFKTPNLYD